MFCRHCGEENLENAVYCKNCGTKLIKEEVKQAEIITDSTNNQQKTSSTTSTTTSSNSSSWIGCCLCLIGVFIVFSILGLLGF